MNFFLGNGRDPRTILPYFDLLIPSSLCLDRCVLKKLIIGGMLILKNDIKCHEQAQKLLNYLKWPKDVKRVARIRISNSLPDLS